MTVGCRQLAAAAARRALRTVAYAAVGGVGVWLRAGVTVGVVMVVAGGGLLLLTVAVVAAGGAGAPAAAAGGALGISPLVLSAYIRAGALSTDLAGCTVRWSILAGIGRVESHHGRHFAGQVEIDAAGQVTPPIVGPRLDGRAGTAAIGDTDDGRLDDDPVWDRAVGPMQFIPSSWMLFARDANSDGVADPHNLYDAALTTAAHLCLAPPPPGGAKDLSDRGQLAAALYRYNHSHVYVATVLGWVDHYDAVELDTAGEVTGVGLYTLPVDRRLLSTVDLGRAHHDYPAWDVTVAEGTPVYAVHSGVVSGVSPADSRCGLGVTVAGDDGFSYTYCHASGLLVAWGQRVTVGQQLAASGNTGNSSGPHLHLAITSPDGVAVCPQDVLVAWYEGVALSPAAAGTTGCSD